MKRFEISAYIAHQGSVTGKAIATFKEHESGRFVWYADVEALIKKATYWEEEFRKECRRVRQLCEMRDDTRRALKKVQDDMI